MIESAKPDLADVMLTKHGKQQQGASGNDKVMDMNEAVLHFTDSLSAEQLQKVGDERPRMKLRVMGDEISAPQALSAPACFHCS